MAESKQEGEGGFLAFLEKGDVFAHLVVSGLLLLAAFAVVGASTYNLFTEVAQAQTTVAKFPETALEYLGSLLFAVILLELLSTLLTYTRSKNLESTIKDFLIVGIISSVRKILLVGAHSSLVTTSTDEFVKEAIGHGVMIIGILLLIGGLLLLERRRVARSQE